MPRPAGAPAPPPRSRPYPPCPPGRRLPDWLLELHRGGHISTSTFLVHANRHLDARRSAASVVPLVIRGDASDQVLTWSEGIAESMHPAAHDELERRKAEAIRDRWDGAPWYDGPDRCPLPAPGPSRRPHSTLNTWVYDEDRARRPVPPSPGHDEGARPDRAPWLHGLRRWLYPERLWWRYITRRCLG